MNPIVFSIEQTNRCPNSNTNQNMFCGEFTWLSDLSSAIVICAAMVFPIKRPAISLLNTNKQQSWLCYSEGT